MTDCSLWYLLLLFALEMCSDRRWVSLRRCKWLPDCMEEELARGTQCVEKGLLKAVRDSNLVPAMSIVKAAWVQ